MVRHHRRLSLVAVLLTIALCGPQSAGAAGAPVALGLSLDSAQVGQTVMVEGRNLAGARLLVYFGHAPATGVNPGGSRQRIKVEVPNKVDPRDPDTVTLQVVVDGVGAITPNGPLSFTYAIPQPAPALDDYTTGDPAFPRSVLPMRPFAITFDGSRLVHAHRVPETCVADGPGDAVATGRAPHPTPSQVTFSFDGILYPGNYRFVIGFSDGSSASIDAPGFVRLQPSSPPQIENPAADAAPSTVTCDMTRIVELNLCAAAGLPNLQALPPGIQLQATFTALDLRARVTDPDSTPGSSDILAVGASCLAPAPPGVCPEVFVFLRDDGSAEETLLQQTAINWLEDCSDEPPSGCACAAAVFPVSSGDGAAADDTYTRRLALNNPATPAIVQDCIVAQTGRVLRGMPAGTALFPRIEAIDRSGNISSSWNSPGFVTGADTFSCSGDPCGCCLLLATDPTAPPPTGCRGLEGMLSPDLPSGLCRSF